MVARPPVGSPLFSRATVSNFIAAIGLDRCFELPDTQGVMIAMPIPGDDADPGVESHEWSSAGVRRGRSSPWRTPAGWAAEQDHKEENEKKKKWKVWAHRRLVR